MSLYWQRDMQLLIARKQGIYSRPLFSLLDNAHSFSSWSLRSYHLQVVVTIQLKDHLFLFFSWNCDNQQNKFNKLEHKNYQSCFWLPIFYIYIDKGNKESMNLSECLSVPDMFDGQSQLFNKVQTQPEFREDEYGSINEENQRFRIKEKESSVLRKIKIKTSQYKTENDRQSQVRTIHRLKTSPLKNSPLKEYNLRDQVSTLGTKKIKVKKIQLQCPQTVDNKENKSCCDRMPIPRKLSLTYSKTSKSYLTSIGHNGNDRSSSKSKKKIQFTVFEEKRRSLDKSLNQSSEKEQRISPKKQTTSTYSIPYPCTRNIVIDLFDPVVQQRLSQSKSKEKSVSKKYGKSPKSKIHKSINKSLQSTLIEQKIQSSIQKLSRFQIFNDYKSQMQVSNMLRSFYLAGEPECKWTLLVIDEIYKKMRKPQRQ